MENASSEPLIVAIDGVSGSGKSSTAREVARRLGIRHIDTGAMYRAHTLLALQKSLPPENVKGLVEVARGMALRFEEPNRVWVNGEDVSEAIRGPEVSSRVSDYCQAEPVREVLVAAQRRLGLEAPSVVEGRDIGTVVFPDAEFKFYMTAHPEVRAKRRLMELNDTNNQSTLAAILENIQQRDQKDSSRVHSPLILAPDAQVIDTSNLTFEQQVTIITDFVLSRRTVPVSK